MAKATRIAQYNRHLHTFEHMERMILAGIDKRAARKEVEADAMSNNISDVNENGERTWTFN